MGFTRMVGLRIRSTVALRGINPYVLISAKQAGFLKAQWRRPLPVILRIPHLTRESWTTNLMPAGDGSFYLYLHEHIRQVAGLQVGDTLRASLQFNEHYRGGPAHPMPKWFRDALHDTPAALYHWRRLIPSRKKEILRYFAALKSPSAQARNAERAIRVLSGERGRFMAREWNGGQ